MKHRSFLSSPRATILACGLLICLLVVGTCLTAAPLRETHVTQVVKSAKLCHTEGALRQAAVGQSLHDGDTIDTGVNGQIELALPNETIARLGAKTNVILNDGARTIALGDGAVLFQITKGAGRLKIKSDAIAVVSTGATGIVERHGRFYVKVLVLEGTVRCYLTNRLGESLLLRAGQILIAKPDATALPEPADFDIARELKTCLLIRDFQPLQSQSRIESEKRKQMNLITRGTYIPSNLVIFGRGTQVTVVSAPSVTPPAEPLTNSRQQSHAP